MIERIAGAPGSTPLVLLHGWGCTPAYWERLVPELEAGGFEAWAHTAPGYGSAAAANPDPDPDPEWTFAAAADDLADVISRHVGTPVHLLAHSMGSYTACALAARHPGLVRTLTMMGIVPDPPPAHGSNPAVDELVEHGSISAATVFSCLEAWYGTGNLPPQVSGVFAAALRQLPAAVLLASALACTRGLDQSTLSGVTAPTQVIMGRQDRARSAADVRRFVAAAPNRCLTVIEETGHMPHWNKPQATYQALQTFIEAETEQTAGAAEDRPAGVSS